MSSPLPLRKSPQGSCRGTPGAIAAIALILAVAAQGSTVAVTKPGKKRQSLLSRKRTEDPGYYRNSGVRGGVLDEDMGRVGDDGSKQDSQLGYNVWTSDSMSNEFRFLDNLKPTAPMDSVQHGDGAYGLDAMYIPEYLNSDTFPAVAGKGCTCETATAATGRITCDCGNSTDTDHYTWMKETPITGTNKYTLEPADITYRAGDYWRPSPSGGVVSPAEAMPRKSFPNQAPGDQIYPVPASADGDRLGAKYARYLDQVQARFEECDTVSDKCTVPCQPGDYVEIVMGSTIANAKIEKAFVGNAALVEISPIAAASAMATVECPLEASCSVFRFCGAPDKHCVRQVAKESFNWQGKLASKFECPPDSWVCRTVSQVVMATMLKKDGKACRMAAR